MQFNEMMAVSKIYHTLFKRHGPQGWWPIFDKQQQRCVYHLNAPRNNDDVLEICLGALLTQNTAWTNVEKALQQLHKQKLIGIKAILAAEHEQLAAAIRSAGYFNQKAARLKIFADFLTKNTISRLQKKETTELRKQLLAVKGIGQETADSMLVYAFNKPSFVVDAYTKRIFARLGFCKEDVEYHELQSMIAKQLPKDINIYKEYHALIVEHAKVCCQKKTSRNDCIFLNK